MGARELTSENIAFPESPRWHEDRLWFSDVYDFKLKAVDLDGNLEVIAEVPGRPSGLGVLPDGRMLMATGVERKLHAVSADGVVTEVADLSSLATGFLNDMVVDAEGRAYVGDTGFNPASGEPFRPGRTWLVAPGREPEIAAEDVHLHNGCAISPDGRTLYVAETFAHRITAFAIGADGRLADRALHAELPSRPDGMCLDAEGALWVAMVQDSEFLRVDRTGAVVERIPSPAPFALACMLGGPERRHLFLDSADTTMERLKNGDSVGRIDVVEVPVPGAGFP
ncbi:MAG: SMP-30/gluconolactonase/LRE family protein [Actinobacteria bacterium]|nr:SMP-30/gluconolactonase/LRE family protein [Actinomycetota bacterium]